MVSRHCWPPKATKKKPKKYGNLFNIKQTLFCLCVCVCKSKITDDGNEMRHCFIARFKRNTMLQPWNLLTKKKNSFIRSNKKKRRKKLCMCFFYSRDIFFPAWSIQLHCRTRDSEEKNEAASRQSTGDCEHDSLRHLKIYKVSFAELLLERYWLVRRYSDINFAKSHSRKNTIPCAWFVLQSSTTSAHHQKSSIVVVVVRTCSFRFNNKWVFCKNNDSIFSRSYNHPLTKGNKAI